MISFEIKNPGQVEQFIRTRGERVRLEVSTEMQRQMVGLQAGVITNLSGRILKNRTGTLRRGVGQKVESDATSVTGLVYEDPSVPYAKIHEYGGAIRIPEVAGKLMVFQSGGKTVFTQKHRAFTVNMPERSFMRLALSEKRATIIAGLRGALQKGLAE